MEQNIPPIIAGALAAQEAINALGAGKPETPDEYAARHREQAAASKADRLGALAASLKEDSEHVTSDERISIVGVGGLLTSGKDAFADYLVTSWGYTKTFMSNPLHQWLLTQNPWIKLDKPVQCMEGWTLEPGEFHPYNYIVHQVGYTEAKEQTEIRRALQRIGTECGRKLISENVWADAMEREIRQLLERGINHVVVTGIRYENELKMIQRLGGETVWIERPSARASHEEKIRSAAASADTATHSSEVSLDVKRFDSVIENDGSLEQLFERADRWVNVHRGNVIG